MEQASRRIAMISVDRITVLNPRTRERRKFGEIVRNIDASYVTWKISYRSDPTDAWEKFSRLGIDMSLATFASLDDVHQWTS